MTLKRKALYARLMLLMAPLLWGFGFIVLKNSLNLFPVNYIMAFRFTMAAVGLIVIFHKRLLKMKKKDLLSGAVLGVLLYIAYTIQTYGLALTTPGKNAFITTFYVVVVPFCYWIFKRKKPKIYNIAAALICLTGIGFLSLNQDFSIGTGDLLTLVAGIFYAIHITCISIYSKNRDPFVLTIVQFAAVAVISWSVAGVSEPFPATFSQDGILGILYLGFFSTMIALLFQTIGQKYTSPVHTSLLLSLESPFGLLFSILFFGEYFSVQMLLGCVLIALAVLISETRLAFLRPKSKRGKTNPAKPPAEPGAE